MIEIELADIFAILMTRVCTGYAINDEKDLNE